MRRRRRGLADIGPNTKRLYAVRDGIRGVRRALERGSCKDAAALLRLTNAEVKRLPQLDKNTQFWLDVERARVQESCKTGLGRRRRRA